MNIEEFREILTEHCKEQGIETHKNTFKVMSSYVIINRLITLNGINSIRLVGHKETDDPEHIDVWFNMNHILLSELHSLNIGEVRSYLK